MQVCCWAAPVSMALALRASAATPDSSKALDPRDKMNIWEGRWNEIVHTKETPYGHAASTPALRTLVKSIFSPIQGAAALPARKLLSTCRCGVIT